MVEAQLAELVGPQHVVTDADLRAGAEVDWTGRWRGTARAVVRPGTAQEVAAVLRACADAGVPVVPQGGNTGLVGGGVPAGVDGAVVLSTRRLTGLEPVLADGTVVAGAGATLSAVQAHAAAAGWQLGMDWAARDSATVGGAIATNAGGLRVLRWGPARAQLVGAEVALASGELLSRVDGPLKDSTGYDLSGLLCGSEGTLGVLTRLRLRLVPPLPARRAVALVGVPGIAAAIDVLAAVRRAGLDLAAAEVVGDTGLALLDLPAPLPEPWAAYLLVEVVGGADELAEALAGADGVGDAVLAADPADRARLWRYREEVSPAVTAAGVPIKLDVSVPAARLTEVWDALPALVGVGRTILYGHLAESNLHVNLLDVPDEAEEAVADRVLRLVAGLGGSISAEHGIGRAKTPWLHLTRSPAELAVMRAIKKTLDPTGILNPGVLLT
ncbi:MAG TPA: FAD-binding oxidoreductase [Mycobacteriales bacterium]|nr:FAD-binding oxidoreductase [Mycobacteriales bacterium]